MSERPAPSLRARFRGALLGVVVGDALGAPFEGWPGPVPASLLQRLEAGEAPLRYTDDTAMTGALAESLLACRRLDLDHLAATFAEAYEREPDRGYGAGTAGLLARVAAGADWHEAAPAQFGGRGSFGNGAAMRVAPVALHAEGPGTAAEWGRASASVTHTHVHAVDAAGVQGAAVALALCGHAGPALGQLPARLQEWATTARLQAALDDVAALAPGRSAAEVAAVTGTGVAAAEAVPAAVAAVALNPGSFADTVRFAVSMGGDTDTIAAMAGAIAGARHGEDAVPRAWLRRVEGVPWARRLADALAAEVERRGASRAP